MAKRYDHRKFAFEDHPRMKRMQNGLDLNEFHKRGDFDQDIRDQLDVDGDFLDTNRIMSNHKTTSRANSFFKNPIAPSKQKRNKRRRGDIFFFSSTLVDF